MKKLRKWNYSLQAYEDYEVPNDWNVQYFCFELEEVINCCQCGAELTYGESYTSKEVHSEAGFGYGVCSDCYNKEIAIEKNEGK